MLYLDTSVIVKLYVKEAYSTEVIEKIKKTDSSIPLTHFHHLEFINALKLKIFRNEASEEEVNHILSNFDQHQSKGIYYRPGLNWSEIFQTSIKLSENFTSKVGSRSLDILHVATALSLKANSFFSFDDRQLELASQSELKIEKL